MSIDPPLDPSSPPRRMARLWIARLAAGEIDDKGLDALRRWRDENAEHNAAFEEERRLYRSLGPLESEFAGRGHPQKQAMPRRGPKLLGASAALSAFVVAWIMLDPLVMIRADRTTGPGEIAQLALPDGSSALLNSESAIQVDYDGRQRRVHILRGEAWFDVRRDRDHPFVVEADGVTARALGTAYSVRLADRGAVTLAVDRGVVGFTGANGGEGIAVPAGRSARIDPDHQPVFLAQRPADMLAWRSRRVIIDNETLSEVAGELGRYRRGKILVLGSAASRRVSGILKVDDIDRGLEGLAASQGLSITHITPWLVVLR
jgi:transmembrane sensor